MLVKKASQEATPYSYRRFEEISFKRQVIWNTLRRLYDDLWNGFLECNALLNFIR